MAKSNTVSPARRTAFEILRRVEEGAYASILLTSRQSELKPQDRALTQELVLGVLRQQLFLDTLIAHFSNRQANSLDQPVRIALRLGLYQLRFLNRIPASAAVNESVNLTRLARARSAEGFVNAVLRRATRESEYDPLSEISDPIEKLAIGTSHPRWLIERWVNHFGFEFTADIARANNETPPLAFRIVQHRSNEAEALEALRVAGANPIHSVIARGGWRLEGPAGRLIEMAKEGKVYIQDEASQLVGETLAKGAGATVLDICAAPGGKTTLVADLLGDRASVVAADVNESRLRTVAETARLHQLSNIQFVVMDGMRPLPAINEGFDRVLVDTPCSGTGTLRRNPEIRWRISAADLQDLSARQKQILFNAASSVKHGGWLIYSTCSVEPEENEEIVSFFLSNHPEFEKIELNLDSTLMTQAGDVRTWPHREGSDGFFFSALKRTRRVSGQV